MDSSSTRFSVWIVIPVLNEQSIICDVLSEIRKSGFGNIIVVDDGSADGTFERVSDIDGVTAVRHLLNRGKGAAVRTGIEVAQRMGADIVVTLDGDGQHDPADIAPMVELIREGYDAVLGSRLKNREGMPVFKVVHNFIANIFVLLMYGLWVTDSQSGFRAYSKKALTEIETDADRYGYDSEVIREIRRHGLRFVEVPVQVRYTEYSMNKAHRMNVWNGIRTFIRMIISS